MGKMRLGPATTLGAAASIVKSDFQIDDNCYLESRLKQQLQIGLSLTLLRLVDAAAHD